MLLISFLIFMVAYLGFALTQNHLFIIALFILYGLFQGIFRAVGKSMASDFVPEFLRAGGIGWYSTTVGIFQLLASIIAGILWDRTGHATVFFYGAAMAAVGGVMLLAFVPQTRLGAAGR